MTPTEASEPENQTQVFLNLNETGENKKKKKAKEKFQVGDHVRISRIKGTFEKGHTQNWTHEVFTVAKVLKQIRSRTSSKITMVMFSAVMNVIRKNVRA